MTPPPAPQIAAEIAARYGAKVARGVTVQRLPMGASARPLPVWNGKKLIYPERVGKNGLMWKRYGNKDAIGNPRAVAAAQARRPLVAEAHGRGLTIAMIAAELDVAPDVVARDLRALNLAPHDPRPFAREERLRRLRGLVAAGHDDRGVADLMGLSLEHVRRMAREAGITLRWSQPAPKAKAPRKDALSPDVLRERHNARCRAARAAARAAKPNRDTIAATRRAAVAKAHAAGLSIAETAATVPGATIPLVRADRRKLKLPPNAADLAYRLGKRIEVLVRPRAEPKPGKRAALESQLAAAHDGGQTVDAIAAATGMARRRVANVLRRAGRVPSYDRALAWSGQLQDLVARAGRGETGQQIADAWGVQVGTVYQYASRKGVALSAKASPPNRGKVCATVAARRDQVARLRADGATLTAMQAQLGISRATLCSDITALGLAGTSPNVPAARSAAARDPGLAARVLALHDAGMAYNAIGRAIGLSWWTAKRIVRAACKARAAGGAA